MPDHVTDTEIEVALAAYFVVLEQQSNCPDDHPHARDQDHWDRMAMRAALTAGGARPILGAR